MTTANLREFADREILVVDDDEDFREIVVRHLRRAGLSVVEAGSALEALARCDARVPALVLMDVWMPGASGIQATALLRARRSTAQVPVILMSAQWRDEHQLLRALDEGATDVLAKERSSFELLARVRSALTLERVRHRLHATERKLEDLRQYIPLCAGCKQVRTESGEWETIEAYLRRHVERETTHGICPTCRDRYYGAVGSEA